MMFAPIFQRFDFLAHGFGEKAQGEMAAAIQALGRGAGPEPVFLRQQHGARCLRIDAPQTPPEGDGLITARPGLALAVFSADCAPILLAEPDKRMIGAVHAGWRGALAGVAENAVTAMVQAGAAREKIIAAIGPAISGQVYEVGVEFYREHMQADAAYGNFFARRQGKYFFDLPASLRWRLSRAGVRVIWQADQCTFQEKARFFSYRRDKTQKGRQISLIAICP